MKNVSENNVPSSIIRAVKRLVAWCWQIRWKAINNITDWRVLIKETGYQLHDSVIKWSLKELESWMGISFRKLASLDCRNFRYLKYRSRGEYTFIAKWRIFCKVNFVITVEEFYNCIQHCTKIAKKNNC